MIALITESENKNKKFDVHLFQDGIKIKQLSFGDNRYEDFTQHKDKERMKLYSLRHKKENWEDPFTME